RKISTQRQREEEESTRLEKSIEEVENTRLENSINEEREQKETFSIAEPFPVSSSIDTFFVKPIRYANYSFKSMIDMYSDFKGSLLMILKEKKILKRMMKRKEDDNIDDDVEVSMSDRERRSKTQHDIVKFFSINEFQTLKDEKLEDFFLSPIVLDTLMPEDNNVRFQNDHGDLNAFNNYPWGYDGYFLTVKYLLTKLSSNTNNLYGFPWAFMVSPSTDTFFVKPIKYANYSFESMIDMHSNLRGSLFLSLNYVSFLILGRFYENKN
ncbi:hypothetical protein H5410_047249, partial [Solanum commersonii]